MNTLPIPWFLTAGQSGNDLANNLDSYVNKFSTFRPVVPNTYYAPNASIRYDETGRPLAKNGDNQSWNDAYDNSDLFDLDPSSRAQILSRDGTSRQWACRQASPFHAPFAKIRAQRRIEWEYYKAGCSVPVFLLVSFFLVVHLMVGIGATSYYIKSLPNPCMSIVIGPLLEWYHAATINDLSQAPLPIIPTTVPIAVPPIRQVSSSQPPTVAQNSIPEVVASGSGSLPSGVVASFFANIFSPQQQPVANDNVILESKSISSGQQPATCIPLKGCDGQWSRPSAEWISLDPNAANFVFRGCRSYCTIPSKILQSQSGICECSMPGRA